MSTSLTQTPFYEFDKLKLQLCNKLLSFFSNLSQESILNAIELPKEANENGDLCIPIPKLRLPGNPADIAKNIASSFVSDEIFTSAFNKDKRALFKSSTEQVLKMKSSFGTSPWVGLGQTIVIDYSSPNIAKPFHAGHLRSTVIGSFAYNANKALGYNVIGINYLGDWGKQYGLLAIGFGKYGDEQALNEDPIKHLFEVYVKISNDAAADPLVNEAAREYFKKMENGDETALALWRRFREMSIRKYIELYKRLNIHFDVFSGESCFENAMEKYVQQLEKNGLTSTSDGAVVVDLNAEKLGKVLIKKSNGTTLYMTRDIAAAFCHYEEYKFFKKLYVVGTPQDLHFQQLFKVLEKMKAPFAPEGLQHINFGMVKGMKTRTGNVVFLEDIINDARVVMLENMKKNPEKYAQIENPEETADILAVSALLIQDMSSRRIKDYAFDIERVTSFEGDTGPYLQYAHARLRSIERRVQEAWLDFENNPVDASALDDVSSDSKAQALAWHISQYPQAVLDGIRTYEPCCLVTYLMTLSHLVSSALEVLWVMGQEENIARARLALLVSARITLSNGLTLLSIRPLDRM